MRKEEYMRDETRYVREDIEKRRKEIMRNKGEHAMYYVR